jgi:eukaryotic-like serine/threonine-protein kinase
VTSTPRPSDDVTQYADTSVGDASQVARRPEPLTRGDTLGRYVVLERIGIGGMGEVFAAYDPELDRKIAVKLLRSSAGGSRSAGAERLIREAKAMAKLSHRNVITVHDVGTHAGRVFVAMEYIDGGTLADWMGRGPHPRRQVLERFRAAGAGLAAAHAQGLVHRDFKPANVLLGGDGRVRVADFGLARQARDVDRERHLVPVPGPGPAAEASAHDDTLASPLTRTGTMLGTPAYMAPEQYHRGQIDARADQFSFCVALYEALYGERPFNGDTLHVLMFAVLQGRVREPPPGSSVPGGLRRVLIRGLAHDPEQRWPNMDALLSRLRRDPAVLRRRGLIVAGLFSAGLVLAGVSFGQHMGSPAAIEAPVCVGAEQALGDTFDVSDRVAIEARFAAHGAADTATELLGRLDQWAQNWQLAWIDACRATRIRGDQSEDLLDRRMACLELQRSHFTAFVDTMAQADQTMATRAVDLFAGLDTLARCSDRAALMQQVPLPTEPERVAAIQTAEASLEKIRLFQLAGRPRDAAILLDQQQTLVELADWGPLTAVFLAAQAWQRIREDRPAEGKRLLKRAFATAISVGDDSLARAIARRVAAAGKDEPEQAVESLEWLDLATALATREGSDDSVLAQLALVRSQIFVTLGDYEQAQDAAAEGLERLTRAEPEGMTVGSALYQLGVGELALGHHAKARAYLDRAEQVWSRELGPEHLNVLAGHTLGGQIARETGDLAGARATFEAVLAVKRRNLGPDAGETLNSELELARTLAGLAEGPGAGELELALALAEHVLTQRRIKLAPRHSSIGAALISLAAIERRAGELELAHAHAIEAEQILRAVYDPSHPKLTAMFEVRAEIQRDRGELEASPLAH